MQKLGRKATGMDDTTSIRGDDSQSFASVSINNHLDYNHYSSDNHRRSSLLSTNSGAHLPLSSPSPNPSSQLLLPDDLNSGRILAEDAISTKSTTFNLPTNQSFNSNKLGGNSLTVQNIQINGSTILGNILI